MTDFKLSEQDKNRIRYRLSLNDESKLFEVITDIVNEHLKMKKARRKLAEKIINSHKQKNVRAFWQKEKQELYNIFLSLSENVKKGQHTKEFVNTATETGTNLSDRKLEEYYREFVKNYALQEIDNELFNIADIQAKK